QLVVLAIVLVVLGWLGGNASRGLESRGMSATDFSFINLTSGFDISEKLIEYDRNSTYGRAFLAGALNTLLVSVVGIVLASILGLIVGIARLSTNWLTSTIARAFVELMRNVPLLVLMFFLYAGVLLQLPRRENTLQWLGGRVLLNNRGVALPWFKPTATFGAWLPYLAAAVVVAGVLWYFRNRTLPTTGRPAFSFGFVLLGFVVVAAIGGVLVKPLMYQVPFIDGLNYAKDENRRFIGLVMSPEFFGVLMSLVLYTGAYIGEVVRAGIQAVSKGQREAATALGLSQSQSLQLIILPQALRVIIPPLTNQYLNLAKNSSLAIGIGYADLFSVATTTFNQSGQSVQVVLMIMASYLTLSLAISVVMNAINRQIQIKER
ncbi:MAG: ABC transporter permease subunit, partial [Caldilineae bacterium]